MRSLLGGLLTRVATIVGSLTLLAFVLMSVTLDPGRPARVLSALLASDAGKSVAAQVIASQITQYDPKLTDPQAQALARRVVQDPRLPPALAAAEHADPAAVVNAVLASVQRYDPAAATAIAKYLPRTGHGAPAVSLVPDSVGTTLFRFRHRLGGAALDGLLIAIAAAAAALVVAPRRDRVLRRLGWWCIGATIFQVAFWWGLPALLDRMSGQWPVLIAVAVRAAGSAVVGVLVSLLLTGAALLGAGYLGHLLVPSSSPTPPSPRPEPRPGPYRSVADPAAPSRTWTA